MTRDEGRVTARRRRSRVIALWIAAALVATPASAQIVQSVHVGMGAFFPRGFDSRASADVLVADLIADEPLTFELGQFRSGQFFGEWDLQCGNHVAFGAGVGYYRSHVMSAYRNRGRGGPDLYLRIVPVTGIVRVLPFGSPRTMQPYFGIGVDVARWRYSESGQFLDDSHQVFSDRFSAAGTGVGPVFLGGVRLPVGGGDALTVEWRYQYGVGHTGGRADGFLGDKIDLGGGVFNVGFLGRF